MQLTPVSQQIRPIIFAIFRETVSARVTRYFAYRAIVYSFGGHFFIAEVSQISGFILFPRFHNYVFILAKKFTRTTILAIKKPSSGHPGFGHHFESTPEQEIGARE
jgi:hypothetical protein